MKAITLWEPWATLIAYGYKKFETRSWLTRYRGDIVIHAAKRRPQQEDFNAETLKALYEISLATNESFDFHLGSAIAIGKLVSVFSTEDVLDSQFIGEDEAAFGDYSPNRFAWWIQNVRRINPYPLRGQQGLWNTPSTFQPTFYLSPTHNPLRDLYTIGYSGRKLDELKAIVAEAQAVLVDIRFSPFSRVPHWRGDALGRVLGERYHHIGALGNKNYRGGSIEIVDMKQGVAEVISLLSQSPVILMCACKNYHTCHRKVVADFIESNYGIKAEEL